MSRFSELELISKDGTKIAAWSIIPENPKAALQLVHGMMEHSGRYREFASWMAERSVAVYMNDHRGHGKNLKYIPGQKVRGKEIYGHFANRNGWVKSVETLHDLTELIKRNHPGLPVFILGHSMGSVMVQSYLRKYARGLQGAILSGPMRQPRSALNAGIMLAEALRVLFGCRYRSGLLKNLSYGNYSKYFKPQRTDFDWLCSDPKVVDEYVNDPLCGFPCTAAFYSDFFRGIRENLPGNKFMEKLSLCIFAGKNDPTGHFGKDPELLAEYYKNSGCKNVVVKVWPDRRHEMLNEINKGEVWEFVQNWIAGRLNK